MLKFVITVIALGAVAIVKAQDGDSNADLCVVCQQTNANDLSCVLVDDPSALIEQCTTTTGSCFSRINDANGFIERGCGGNLPNNTVCDNELCNRCQLTRPTTEPCNSNRYPVERLSCFICDGDQNSTCADLDRTSSTEHAQLCPIFRAEDTCFSTRAGGNVTRGCASSMRPGRCNHGVCGFCRGNDCNNGNFTTLNGAFTVQSGFKLLFVAIAFLAFVSK